MTHPAGEAKSANFDVKFENVSMSYGSNHVLRDLTLHIPQGQKIAVIGPSGSGKTTLLRLLMGLEQPTAGRILLGDTVVSDGSQRSKLSRVERRQRRAAHSAIGMVFQHFNLFPHLNATENIVLALRHVRHLPEVDARLRAQNLLNDVGLSSKLDAMPRQLSGGQQQRVGIARALALDPEVVLFDEVTSALDPELVGEVLQVIRNLAASTGMTMILVTHEMTFARHVSDRVLFMDGGQVVEDAAPGQIFTEPQTQRCRRFLRAVLDPLDWAKGTELTP